MTAENSPDSHSDASEKRLITNDRPVTLISTSGKYDGLINLNAASTQIHRVSDMFIKEDISFLPLYDAVFGDETGKEILVNIRDIAIVIPRDGAFNTAPELRKDVRVKIALKYGLGEMTGCVNLWGENQPMDRVSDLLNVPGKKWLTVYDVAYGEEALPAAIVNFGFISTVANKPS